MISYLFLSSIVLECAHLFIQSRSFEFSDLFGNILGVIVGMVLFTLFRKLNENGWINMAKRFIWQDKVLV